MDFIPIDTPNTSCMYKAFFELIAEKPIASFVEVGPGMGDLSEHLCGHGARGVGIDFSPASIQMLNAKMSEYCSEGSYSIIQADFMSQSFDLEADLVFSMLVMEHVEDDRLFIEKMKSITRKHGIVLVGVPGRKRKWGIDDELYGHYRRYDRQDLLDLFAAAGLINRRAWSVAVPISNMLFGLTNFISKRSLAVNRKSLSLTERTRVSGLKDIPFKTSFPKCFKLLFNDCAYYPFYLTQRLFRNTNLGLTMIGCAERP